jgi:hypothetical protein
MTLETEITKLFNIKCEIEKTVKSMRKTMILFLSLFGGAILYSIITLTTVQRRQLETVVPMVKEINDNYAPMDLVINISKSYSLQLRQASAIANKDSSALDQTRKEFDELRLEWYKDLKRTRGGDGSDGSSEGGVK